MAQTDTLPLPLPPPPRSGPNTFPLTLKAPFSTWALSWAQLPGKKSGECEEGRGGRWGAGRQEQSRLGQSYVNGLLALVTFLFRIIFYDTQF